MSIKWKIKRFEQLSTTELYSTLKLRSEIFVVEQNCVYLDVDDKDQPALHLMGFKNEELIAYCRIFAPGDYFDKASIGRVVVKSSERKNAIGHELMRQALRVVETELGKLPILISAQLYLERFYASHGFVSIGESYLEDDIPHIKMLRG